ncbi:5-formyltetrahydrofolate cyclo-ligase [Bacteroidales bacterium]|nr:5-formyltetrahydrofolate cyclo-ligase [Bacteroidales bacterium]
MEINSKSREIALMVEKMPIWNRHVFHIFMSIEGKNEVQTSNIIDLLQHRNKQLVLSSSDMQSRQMKHFILSEHTKIYTNTFGIPEPSGGIEIKPPNIDLVFVPLLAYDLKGNRVGFGKGFYDIFLSQCRPDCLKIGLSFFAPEAEISDTNEMDICLDYCVSPNKIYNLQETIHN